MENLDTTKIIINTIYKTIQEYTKSSIEESYEFTVKVITEMYFEIYEMKKIITKNTVWISKMIKEMDKETLKKQITGLVLN